LWVVDKRFWIVGVESRLCHNGFIDLCGSGRAALVENARIHNGRSAVRIVVAGFGIAATRLAFRGHRAKGTIIIGTLVRCKAFGDAFLGVPSAVLAVPVKGIEIRHVVFRGFAFQRDTVILTEGER
jgi:hypothetical protein